MSTHSIRRSSRPVCSRRLIALLLLASGCALAQHARAASATDTGVNITEGSNTVRVEINGELFTEYYFKDVRRPYFYPVIGPDNLPMTRNWPMNSPANEEHDHPHHRSLWFGHGAVNGLDFWTDTNGNTTILHDGFTEIKSGPDAGVIKSRDKWLAPDGHVVCTDDRTFRVYNHPGGRLFDFEVTLHAANGDVKFGDSKEGTMAFRVAETMKLKGPIGKGHIVNSEGARDGEAWGKPADWCYYYGPVNGKIVGVAVFDNPENPRHPTLWHARDYGLLAANPFALHDMEKKPAGAGDLIIPAGQSVTFRYRFYLHEGDEKQAKVAEMYQEYVHSTQTTK